MGYYSHVSNRFTDPSLKGIVMNFQFWTIFIGNLGGVTRPNYGTTTSNAFKLALNAMIATGGPLAVGGTPPPAIHCYSNNYTPNATTVLSDLTESAFSGYASTATGGWTAPQLQQDGSWISSTNLIGLFTLSALTVTETIYGVYLTDTTGALFAAYKLSNALVLNNIGDGLLLSTTLQVGP